MTSRWDGSDRVQRGAEYDRKWSELADSGVPIHGEADLIASYGPATVLDAGCGTGRVAIELARRRIDVVGVDLDPAMLATARAKAPDLPWFEGDLLDIELDRRFDAVALAGNVMIFLRPGTEGRVVANLAAHLVPGGLFIAGFQLTTAYTLERFDADAATAGLVLRDRFATWEGDPYRGGNYAVSVHRRHRPSASTG